MSGTSSRPVTRVEEPFILNAMVSLVAATALLFLRRDYLLEYFYFDRLLALTHLVTLGFLSSLMMGVLYRLSPALLGITPTSFAVGRVQFVLFFLGAWGMVAHFWMGEPKGMSWSTFCVGSAGVAQIWNFRGLFRVTGKNAWPARFVAASLVYFLLAATLGVLLGLAKGYDVRVPGLAVQYIDNVFAHAHLAGVGWVAMMILGVELKLVPTTSGSPRALVVRYLLLQIGTLGTAYAFLAGRSVLPFAVLLALAFLWHTFGPARAWVSSRAREWELLPLTSLLLATALGLTLSLGWPDAAEPARGRLQLAYGFLGVFGFMVLTVVTVAFKLFPMWVWQERFQEEFGKKPVPGMKDLHSETLRVAANLSLFTGVLLTAVAIYAGSATMLTASVTLMLGGIACFVTNFARVARWELLKLEYRPSEADEAKFKRMFPET